MSTTELQTDYEHLERVIAAIGTPTDPAAGMTAIARFLKNDLVPYLGNIVTELAEIDAAVSDEDGDEDVLSPASAGIFGAVIIDARVLAAEIKKRAATVPQLADLVGIASRLERTMQVAEELLMEITVELDDDDDDDDSDDDSKEGQ